tara:strand:+ start:1243 stop:2292 length:1050 start_codon:yes stop_codon:yes gene_type:complete
MIKKLIGIWNYHEVLNKDRLFISENPGYYLGEDSMKAFYNVYKKLKKDYEIKILNEIENFHEIDLLIFINYPKINNNFVKKALKLKVPKCLMMYEGPTIYPEMWQKHVYDQFDKIFTWHDKLIDNNKFFKINIPSYDLPININKDQNIKKNFCIIMGSNKKSNHSLDLYSKRVEAIEWFEKNHINDLHFYGYGWNKYIFRGNKMIRALNRITFLQKLFAKKFKNYKGEYHDLKIPLFEKYQFSICFENAHSIPGWITEKIFHSIFAGCIPVYLGANNISNHIPSNCYIDFSKFKNFENMYSFMKSLKVDDRLSYINNMQNFINSERFYTFTHNYFTKIVSSEIEKILKI